MDLMYVALMCLRIVFQDSVMSPSPLPDSMSPSEMPRFILTTLGGIFLFTEPDQHGVISCKWAGVLAMATISVASCNPLITWCFIYPHVQILTYLFAHAQLIFIVCEKFLGILTPMFLLFWDCDDISTGSGMIVLLFCFVCIVLDPLWDVNQMGQGCNML